MPDMMDCGRCRATGREGGYRCVTCGGSGFVIATGGEDVYRDGERTHYRVIWHAGTNEETHRCYTCGAPWPCPAVCRIREAR